MKNIIFLTYLNVWSMDKNKGAPSFYKTIEGYIKDNWNVILINPRYKHGVTPVIEGLKNITFKPIFLPLCSIKKIAFFGRILHNIQGNYMLYKLGKKELKKFDNKAIIYSYEVDVVNAGRRLKNKYKLPFVTRFQGTILAPLKNSWLNRLKKYPHYQALKTKADITIMTDDGTLGDKVLKKLKNQSEQLFFWKNGVDINTQEKKNEIIIKTLRENLGLSSFDEILITVSRLVSWKKINRSIEALSVVVKKRSKCKLIIVGDGDEKQRLIDLTKQLNLTTNVIFVGSILQTEIKNYLDLADVFLSLYDLSNVGNPLLEAMSCGKPIITLNVGDTNSLITNEENGILLNVEDIDNIPEYIHKILDNNHYAQTLGNKAKEYAKKNFWSWDDRINAELDVINVLRKKWYL